MCETKKCKACLEEKCVDLFYKNKIYKDGRHYRCKTCDDNDIPAVKPLIIEGFKTCNTCKNLKSNEDFHKDAARKNGYEHTCKQCKKIRSYTIVGNETDGVKICIKCNIEKSFNYFKKDRGRKDGLSHRCVDCLTNKKETPIIGIYKITSPSGKIYIGQAIDVKRRFKDYKGFQVKGQPRLLRSFQKYGWFYHTFEIVEESSIEDLNCRERYWQEFYDVLEDQKGLNCKLTECGDERQQWTKESLDKLSNSLKQYNKDRTENKINEKQVINTETKKIYRNCITAIQEENLQITDGTLRKKLKNKNLNDTYFMFLEDYEKYGAIQPIKRIQQHVVDTRTGVEYENLSVACKELNLSYTTISRYLYSGMPNGSYIVKSEDYNGQIHQPVKSKGGRHKKIVDEIEGLAYESAKLYGECKGITRKILHNILNKGKEKEGIKIRYYDPDTDSNLKLIKEE